MANARLVSVYIEGGLVHAAARVEGGSLGGLTSATEYNVTVPLDDATGRRKPPPQIRAELIAAAAALRRQQQPPSRDEQTLQQLLGEQVTLND